MRAQHTPGPWRIVDNNGVICIAAPEGHPHKTIAAIGHDERKINAWRVEKGIYPDNCANAQLIAAAPDLLAALENLVTFLEETEEIEHVQFGYDDDNCIMCNARSAISKAIGA